MDVKKIKKQHVDWPQSLKHVMRVNKSTFQQKSQLWTGGVRGQRVTMFTGRCRSHPILNISPHQHKVLEARRKFSSSGLLKFKWFT